MIFEKILLILSRKKTDVFDKPKAEPGLYGPAERRKRPLKTKVIQS